jgi:hypothetical protein
MLQLPHSMHRWKSWKGLYEEANWKITIEKYSITQDVCVKTEYGNDGIHEYVLTMYASSIEN